MAIWEHAWWLSQRYLAIVTVRRVATVMILLTLGVAVGCRPQAYEKKIPGDSRKLRGVLRTYSTATRDLGRPPEKIEELTNVLAPASDDPLGLLTSSRDGEVFVVVWGLKLASTPPNTIVAYERSGVEGKRMVVNRDGVVTEVSEEEFATLHFPKDHIPGGN